MNRRSPRLAREALLGVAVIFAALGAGCRPEHPVKPGAPVLRKMTIVEADGTATEVTGTTADCPSIGAEGGTEGSDCNPVVAPPEKTRVCRLETTYCHCVPKPEGDCSIQMDVLDTQGSWVCSYGPQVTVVATFDRLLDGNQLGDGPPAPGIATLESEPATSTPATTLTNYTPNGSLTGLVFPAFAGIDGPTLAVNGNPAIPTGRTVTIALNRSKVLAKDGKTSFTATGFIQDGTLTFKTNPFAASLTVPVAPPPPPPPPPDASADDGGADGGAPEAGAADAGTADDGGADGGTSEAGSDAAPVCMPPPTPTPTEPDPVPPSTDPVTIVFNSAVDLTMLTEHVTVKINNVALPATGFEVKENAETGAFEVTLAPTPITPPTTPPTTTPTPWPASSKIDVTVDATLADKFGTQLGAPATASFTTTAAM